MSHYTSMKLHVKDRECLIKALCDMGWERSQVEVHKQAAELFGYQGDKRVTKANVIIRKQFVPGLSNDIGFEKMPDGKFNAHISDYDRIRHNEKWMGKFMQSYTTHNAIKKMKKKGAKVRKNIVHSDGTRELLFEIM